jgi:hypothetical protein
MTPAQKHGYSNQAGWLSGPPTEFRIGLAIVAGVVVIVALLALYALASGRLDVVPPIEPVAYYLVAIAAATLLAIFLITFMPNEYRAGFYIVAVWLLTMFSMFVVLRYFG